MTTIQQAIDQKLTVTLATADSELLTEIQTKLKFIGYYHIKIDGIYGQHTQTAWDSFKKDNNLGQFNLVGAGSLRILLDAKPLHDSPYAAGYFNLWNAAVVNPDKVQECDSVVINQYLPNKSLYEKVESSTGVPWYVVALIHYRESDCDFTTHLFNGDPLSHKTVNVPAGQIEGIDPPYTWEQSAIASLKYDGLDQVNNWSIPSTLYQLEKYNGLGYFHKNVNSPYVWSGTSQYTSGKYVADGHYDSNAIDEQLGCAALLKRLMARGLV